MNRLVLRRVLALGALVTLLLPSSARADMSFATPNGSTAGGQAVDASVTFTISAGQIQITLHNLEANPTSDIQALNGIQFVLSSGLTAGSLATSSAQHVDITGRGAGQYSLLGVSPTTWNYNAGVNDGSGSGISLTSIGNSGGTPTLIGSPDISTNAYSNANGSITNGSHNPFLFETATFTVDVTGLLASATIASTYFEYGTSSGTNVMGVPAPTPEPASVVMILLGGGMVAGYAGYRRRRASKAAATA
jgi:PEP-CTERM motif